MKKKLLITGASGFLGWNLCRLAVLKWKVCGVCHTHPVHTDGVTKIRLNLTNYGELKKTFSEIRPDAVIHTAAVSQPDVCQVHPSETRKINVDTPADIAGICADLQIPCIFTSTDLVFDGLNPPYSETSPPDPVCIYGEQKARAEQAMLNRYPETAVCRLPLMFGYAQGARNFACQMIRSLSDGQAVRLFTDEYRTPADAESVSEGLLLAMDKKVRGIIHLGGRTRISRYEMGRILAGLLNVSESLIRPVLQKDISTPAPRPPDVSLDSSKAYAMGYSPLDIGKAYQSILIKMIDYKGSGGSL